MDNDNSESLVPGTPTAEIPDLKKKKEKEDRKKAGGWWGGAKPGGSFSGATGGTVARSAASAVGASGGAAGATAAAGASGGGLVSFLSGLLSSLTATLSSLTATLLGKIIVAIGAAVFLAGVGMLALGLLRGAQADNMAGMGGGALGALSSSLKIRSGTSDSTGFLANKGEIVFDPVKSQTEAKDQKPADEKVADQPPAADGEKTPDWKRPTLEHNLSGAKLSSSLGGSFGGKNIFSGNSGAPKLNESLGKINLPSMKVAGAKGKMGAMRNAKGARVSQGIAPPKLKANKAFGQLRIAKGMSMLGAGASTADAAHGAAAAAFEGRGNAATLEDPATPIRPNGGGGGGASGGGGGGTGGYGAPDITTPYVADPNLSAMDQANAAALAGIGSMAKQAGDMKKKAMLMIILGAALMVLGGLMMYFSETLAKIFTPFLFVPGYGTVAGFMLALAFKIAVIGGMILAMGAMMALMGAMMMNQSNNMKDQADQMSQQLAQRTGDARQNAINQYCIDDAYNNGTDPANCNPPDNVTQGNQYDQATQQSVREHQSMVDESSHVDQ